MDTDKIRELVELMVDNDLSRIEIEEGESHILLKRGPSVIHTQMSAAPMQAAALPAAPLPAAAPAQPAAGAPAAAEVASNELLIRSPMVGTFYSAADPDTPPFVSVGDTVNAESVVCLVEAMKVFNEIKAEVSGRITKVLVKNAEAVEFDQPLFAVEPA